MSYLCTILLKGVLAPVWKRKWQSDWDKYQKLMRAFFANKTKLAVILHRILSTLLGFFCAAMLLSFIVGTVDLSSHLLEEVLPYRLVFAILLYLFTGIACLIIVISVVRLWSGDDLDE